MYRIWWTRQIQRWLFGSRQPKRSRAPIRPRFRPYLEHLEERTLPSTFTPTTFGDGVSGDSQVNTLRNAVIAANQDTASSGTDVIQLQGGMYTLNIQNTSGPTGATQGDLNLTNTTRTIVIEGAGDSGPNATVIDASQLNDRVFQVAPGVTVLFENLVIQGGNAQDDGTNTFSVGRGGGILNNGGNVTLSNVAVQNNQVTNASAGSAYGGGIYSAGGTLTLTNAVVQNNIASVTHGDVSAEGGGIDDEGSLLAIANSLIAGNQANGGHGNNGTVSQSEGGGGGAGLGGGLYVNGGSVQIDTTTISGNTARGGDGGKGFTGDLVGDNGGDGGPAAGGGVCLGPGEVTVRDSTTSGNFVVGGDGGNGGNGSTETANSNTNREGGNGGKGGGADGGGFHIETGTLTLIDTTVADNNPYSGKGGAGGNGGGNGLAGGNYGGNGGNGGVAWGGGIGNAQILDTFNVTIAGNFVGAGGGGAAGIGGIGGTAGLQGLIGSTQGGGIWNEGGNPVNLTNTLIATNVAATGPDFAGAVTTSDHTLIGDDKDATGFSAVQNGDIVGTPNAPVNPLLGPLGNNGGPTQTMALLPGSPAIDRGDNSTESATGPNDQRGSGFSRVVHSIVDLGAVEFSPVAVTTTAGNAGATFSANGQNVTLTASVSGSSPVTEGTVTFTVYQQVVQNGYQVGTAVQGNVSNGSASASFTVPNGLAVGSYIIAVSYSDAGSSFADGSDTSGTLTINPVPVAIVGGSVGTSFHQSTQTVTLTASVSPAITGQGVVTFTVVDINDHPVGNAVLGGVSNGSASASFTVPQGLAVGTYYIVPSYNDISGSSVQSSQVLGVLTITPPPSRSRPATPARRSAQARKR